MPSVYGYLTPRQVAAVVTSSTTLAKGAHTPVDATAGPLTMTLPTGATMGSFLSVEKIDASVNIVTVSGSLRGIASSLTLTSRYETIDLIADGVGSWHPIAGHKTKATLDALYGSGGPPAGAAGGDLSGTYPNPTVPGLAAKAADSAVVHNSGTETVAGVKTFSSSPIVPTPTTGTQAVNKAYADQVGGTPPDATTGAKGVVQLAGDLAGTATAPTVPGLAAKAIDAAVVHLAGNETVAGVKTFSSSPVVPNPTSDAQAASRGWVNLVVAGLTGGTGASDAAAITYDPSNSGVPGDPRTPPIPEYTVASVFDWMNREITDRVQMAYLDAVADTLRLVQGLAGAAPAVTPDGTYVGYAPLDANRLVPAVNLGANGGDSATFLNGVGAFVAPLAAAARTWLQEATDQNLKAMRGDPNTFQNTATLLGASTCYTIKLYLQAKTYTNYDVHCQTIGSGLNPSLYGFALANTDATGTLVTGSGTADAASVWTTTGARTIALGTPLTVASAGWYYMLIQTGTAATQPKVSTGAAHALANIGLAQGANVAPNSASAPLWGTATNGFSGLTPPATTGNIIEGGSTMIFWAGMH